MTYISRRIKLDPYIGRFLLYPNQDPELGKAVFPHFTLLHYEFDDGATWINDGRRGLVIVGGGEGEGSTEFDLLWSDPYATSRPTSRDIYYSFDDVTRFISLDGKYYFHNTGFSKDNGETYTLFEDVSAKAVQGYNLNGNVWYNASDEYVHISLDDGATWINRFHFWGKLVDYPEDYNEPEIYAVNGSFAGDIDGNVVGGSALWMSGIWQYFGPWAGYNALSGDNSDHAGPAFVSIFPPEWLYDDYNGAPTGNWKALAHGTVLGFWWRSWVGVGQPFFRVLLENGYPVLSDFAFDDDVYNGSFCALETIPNEDLAFVVYRPTGSANYNNDRVMWKKYYNPWTEWQELRMPALQKITGDYKFTYNDGALYVTWENAPLFKLANFLEIGDTTAELDWEIVWKDYDVNSEGAADFWDRCGYFHVAMGGNTVLLTSRVETGNHGSYGFQGSHALISNDLGETWRYVPEITNRPGYGRYLVSRDGSTIVGYCYTNLKDYWYTQDGGNPGEEYYGWKMRISNDYGQTWGNGDVPKESYPRQGGFIGDDTLTNLLVYFENYGAEQEIWYSPNGGRGWFEIGHKVPGYSNAVDIGISGDGSTIYVYVEKRYVYEYGYIESDPRGIYKTTDYGDSWTEVVGEDFAYFPSGSSFDYIYVNEDGSGAAWYSYIGQPRIVRVIDGETEVVSVASGAYQFSSDLNYYVRYGTTGYITVGEFGGGYETIQRDRNSFINSYWYLGPGKYEFTEGNYRYAVACNSDLTKIFLVSEDGAFAWLIEGKYGGLIKAISSASYRLPRDIGKVSQTSTFENLKKISSQPDDPQYLEEYS